MRSCIIFFIFLTSSLAEIQVIPATPANIAKFDQIIDVRIEIERQELGVIKDAKMIRFSKNKQKLWDEISNKIDTSRPFAIICRSGMRSAFVADLINAKDLNITILDGGLKALIDQGYMTLPYEN